MKKIELLKSYRSLRDSAHLGFKSGKRDLFLQKLLQAFGGEILGVSFS